MRPFDTYAKRNSIKSDLLIYDLIDKKLRNQIFHVWNNFFNQEYFDEKSVNAARERIYSIICAEEGVKSLYANEFFVDRDPVSQVDTYFERLEDVDKILSAIEVIFFYMDVLERVSNRHGNEYRYDFKQCVEDLNKRFFENNVGYQYQSQMIIKVSNELLHQEVTQRAIDLLSNNEFENANEEFLKSHEHFKHDRFKECLNECLKSFESVLKILIKRNGWNYSEKDTAKTLVSIAFENNLIPIYLQNSFAGIRTILEGSITTIRNKNSGHGQGTKKIIVPKFLASYMLYLTGSTILFLIESDADKTK